MGISLEALYQNASWALSGHLTKLAALQEKAATGQDVNRVSDDPAKANRILGLLSDSRNKKQYLGNLDEVLSVLDLGSSVIQSMTGQLTNARTSMTSVVSGITNDSMRRTLAADINNALEQMVSLANTQRLGQSLFAGANCSVQPYTVQRDSQGQITQVIYEGSEEERRIPVASGVEVSAVLVGPKLFASYDRQNPVFYGDTGAAVGTGTGSAKGDVMLAITGGPGDWQLSTDGGKTWVNADGTETNIAVVNSDTREVLYVDATGIKQAGTEPIRMAGTYDIFNSLICARDLLKNRQNLPEDQLRKMLSDTIDEMQKVESRLTEAFPIVGGRIQALTSLKDSLENMKLNTDEDISRVQDADIAQLSVDLARFDTLYQMSLSVAAKMFSLSFLDFMD